MSDDFERELAFLEMTSSPTFVPGGRRKWRRGTLHSHAERECALGAAFRHRRRAGRGPARVQAHLQRTVADRTPRYRQVLRDQIAATLDEPTDEAIDTEIRDLFAALAD